MTTPPTPHPKHATIGRFRLKTPLTQGSPQALAAKWRGAVSALFPEDSAFHGHSGDRTIPRYPEVHYRWIDGAPALFAIGPAAQRLMAHPWLGALLRLGQEDIEITQADFHTQTISTSLSRRLLRYSFQAPWIALNQENHTRFRGLDASARRDLLDRILVGNLLTMSQAFGWFFEPTETIYAAFEPKAEVPTTIKQTPIIGFFGTFVTNLELPNHLALGRSVSHGFGWFERTPSESRW